MHRGRVAHKIIPLHIQLPININHHTLSRFTSILLIQQRQPYMLDILRQLLGQLQQETNIVRRWHSKADTPSCHRLLVPFQGCTPSGTRWWWFRDVHTWCGCRLRCHQSARAVFIAQLGVEWKTREAGDVYRGEVWLNLQYLFWYWSICWSVDDKLSFVFDTFFVACAFTYIPNIYHASRNNVTACFSMHYCIRS